MSWWKYIIVSWNVEKPSVKLTGPETGPSQKESGLSVIHFQVLCKTSGVYLLHPKLQVETMMGWTQDIYDQIGGTGRCMNAWLVFLQHVISHDLNFGFFLRWCRYVCDGNYSWKNAQGSGRGRPRKPRGRVPFAEGCRRKIWFYILKGI